MVARVIDQDRNVCGEGRRDRFDALCTVVDALYELVTQQIHDSSPKARVEASANQVVKAREVVCCHGASGRARRYKQRCSHGTEPTSRGELRLPGTLRLV